MMKALSLVMVLAVVGFTACGGGSGGDSDADAGPTADAQSTADGGGVACRVVFLEFEGASLHPGADDAPAGASSIITATTTIGSFATGNGGRAARIIAIAAQIQGTLAPYAGIRVVTTRPSAGPYQMIVIGGSPSDAQFPVGVGAVQPLACGAEPSRSLGVGFVFDVFGDDGDPTVANLAVTSIGILAGVRASSTDGDCMNLHAPASTACTIGGAGTARDPADTCDTETTFDEQAAWTAVATCP